jgi:hypothetical protein
MKVKNPQIVIGVFVFFLCGVSFACQSIDLNFRPNPIETEELYKRGLSVLKLAVVNHGSMLRKMGGYEMVSPGQHLTLVAIRNAVESLDDYTPNQIEEKYAQIELDYQEFISNGYIVSDSKEYQEVYQARVVTATLIYSIIHYDEHFKKVLAQPEKYERGESYVYEWICWSSKLEFGLSRSTDAELEYNYLMKKVKAS